MKKKFEREYVLADIQYYGGITKIDIILSSTHLNFSRRDLNLKNTIIVYDDETKTIIIEGEKRLSRFYGDYDSFGGWTEVTKEEKENMLQESFIKEENFKMSTPSRLSRLLLRKTPRLFVAKGSYELRKTKHFHKLYQVDGAITIRDMDIQ